MRCSAYVASGLITAASVRWRLTAQEALGQRRAAVRKVRLRSDEHDPAVEALLAEPRARRWYRLGPPHDHDLVRCAVMRGSHFRDVRESVAKEEVAAGPAHRESGTRRAREGEAPPSTRPSLRIALARPAICGATVRNSSSSPRLPEAPRAVAGHPRRPPACNARSLGSDNSAGTDLVAPVSATRASCSLSAGPPMRAAPPLSWRRAPGRRGPARPRCSRSSPPDRNDHGVGCAASPSVRRNALGAAEAVDVPWRPFPWGAAERTVPAPTITPSESVRSRPIIRRPAARAPLTAGPPDPPVRTSDAVERRDEVGHDGRPVLVQRMDGGRRGSPTRSREGAAAATPDGWCRIRERGDPRQTLDPRVIGRRRGPEPAM